jgi:hypothetical protein
VLPTEDAEEGEGKTEKRVEEPQRHHLALNEVSKLV